MWQKPIELSNNTKSSFMSEPVRGAGLPQPAGRADGGVGPDIQLPAH